MRNRRAAAAKTNAELLCQVRLYGAVGFTAMLLLLGADDALDLWRGRTVETWELVELAVGVAIAALTLALMQLLIQRITLLEGLVSICIHCKRIRTEDGWISVERFVSSRSDAQFSHGLCADCFEREHGEARPPAGDPRRVGGNTPG
jgi:hypothetical protein